MKVDIIAGARPNFIKIAPIIKAIQADASQAISYRLVHTGQHYDKNMSESFFEQLEIPTPNVNLGVGGGTQAEQTAGIMIKYEALLREELADVCLVVGDVTSTLACSIVAKKMNMKVVHVEGGIRSHDLTMPEEINRMVTDSITDYFYTTTTLANDNLKRLGVSEDRIVWVGNTMIDTLLQFRSRFEKPEFWNVLQLEKGKYLVLTLHRPANVDDETHILKFLKAITDSAQGTPVVFPVHPRTRQIIDAYNISFEGLHYVDPQPYLQFNFLVENAMAVITDSGGITEETTVMGVPCLTLRDNTERPETCEVGTNELIGIQPDNIAPAMKKLLAGNWKKGAIPQLWDGKTAQRIVKHLSTIQL